ncbi:hypothetical protein PWO95_01945 [Weissella paramesenteroides]|uniref:hypothetical protein n=1 Tax=Weissella paramesenteroides TaxID=1249 RepID=UPI0023A95EB1|nr:hypothetical protein [Weissella paramesenteroides]WEA53340.1 hypothetical protein PWO95_01945 [Weissella paramesenteroides]
MDELLMALQIILDHGAQILLTWIAVMLTILVLAKHGKMIWKVIRGLVLMFSWVLIYLVDGKTRADKIKSHKPKQKKGALHA